MYIKGLSFCDSPFLFSKWGVGNAGVSR
jgi:hypothetical protein